MWLGRINHARIRGKQQMRLNCVDVGVDFVSNGGSRHALQRVSLETREGEFVSVGGPSGCGKTTLLRAIIGLVPIRTGTIERISCRDDRNERILTVPQEDSLFPWMTVLANAAFGLEMQGVEREKREARARELLDRFGFRGREKDYPHQLSMGMKQRVAIPMQGTVSSLNVSVATGVCLFEIVRQRAGA